MNETSVYIRKVIALIIITILTILSCKYINWKYLLPLSLLTLSFINIKITGITPAHLFIQNSEKKTDNVNQNISYLNKWFINFVGFIYNIIILIFNGLYILFNIYIDILQLINRIIIHIFYFIIWILKLYIPPLIFIYKNIIHYLLKWPWWIYKLTFNNINTSINRNFYYFSFYGAFLFLFIISLFYGIGIILNIPSLIIPGIIFSLLPLAWTFGNIAFLRHNNLTGAEIKFGNLPRQAGISAIKTILFFLLLSLIIIVTEVVLNLLGWIPDVGISLLGISLNLNTFLTLIALFTGVILAFANIILPAHIAIHKNFKPGFKEYLEFIGLIGKKFISYLFSFFPLTIFSLFLSVIPVLIVILSLFITLNLRNNIIDKRITILEEKMEVCSLTERPKITKNILLLTHYKYFPQNTLKKFTGIKELKVRLEHLKSNLLKAQINLTEMEREYNNDLDSLTNMINALKAAQIDEITNNKISSLENIITNKNLSFNNWKSLKSVQIAESEGEIFFTRSLLIQLPVLFFFVIIWISFFGALVLTVLLSYFANVFYDLYIFREDNRVTYFTQTTREIHKKNRNQPLLGFTLLISTGILAVILYVFYHPL